MLAERKLLELLRIASLRWERGDDELYGYRCENGMQSLDRLVFYYEDGAAQYEVQLNSIRHSSGWHHHGTDMTSVILHGGYTWSLRQAGAETALELFSGPGSIIRMAANDAHSIAANPGGQESLSCCVFEKQAHWEEHFPPLPSETQRMLRLAGCIAANRFITARENRLRLALLFEEAS